MAGAKAALSGTVARQLLISVAATALSAALAGKPSSGQSAGIRAPNAGRGDINPDSFILGRYATTGSHVCPPYTHSIGGFKTPNPIMNQVIHLGGRPGQKLVGMMIDGKPVEITDQVHPDYGYEIRIDGKMGHARVRFYDGTQTVADPMLVNRYPPPHARPWTRDMIGTGICYAVLTYGYWPEGFSGFPQATFVLEGAGLYDPRLDSSVGGNGAQRWDRPATWRPSENSAVHIYNLLRGIPLPGGVVYGGRARADQLPLPNWMAAMDACDRPVTNADGTTEPAWRTSYEVMLSDEPAGVIEELAKAASVQLTESGGTWRIRVGGPGVPVAHMSDGDIVTTAEQMFDMFPTLENTFNGVSASFPDPDSGWEAVEAPLYIRSDYVAADRGKELFADLTLAAAPYAMQVQRLSRAYVEEERRFRRHVLVLPPDYGALEPLDAITWTSERNGYVAKVFEVAATTTNPVTQLVSVTLRERDPEDYDWKPGFELPYAPTPITWGAVPVIDLVGFKAEGVYLPDAKGQPRRTAIRLEWATAERDALTAVLWEIKRPGSPEVLRGTVADVMAGSVTISDGIVPGETYEARIRPDLRGYDPLWTDSLLVKAPDVKLQPDDIGQQIWDDFTDIATKVGIETVREFPAKPTPDKIVLKMPEAVLYRWDGKAWVTTIFAGIPDGAIDATKIAQGLALIQNIEGDTLPTIRTATTITFKGRLYSWDGTRYSADVPAVNVTGQLTNDQIAAIAAAKLTGQIGSVQIADRAVSTAKIADAAIEAGKLASGAVTSDKIADASLTLSKFVDGLRPIERVTSLPGAPHVLGRVVSLTTEGGKLYRNTGTGWTASVAAVDVSGQLGNDQIASIAAAKLTGQIGSVQIADRAVSTAKIADAAIKAGKLASGAVTNDKIADAALSLSKFPDGLRPIERVTSLPGAPHVLGRVVSLTTEGGKLYRNTGTGWTASVAAVDVAGQLSNDQIAAVAAAKLTGQITGTQITDRAISTIKMMAGSVVANILAAGSVVTEALAAGAITAGKLAAASVTALALAANSVTAGAIAANAIEAGHIRAGAISTDALAANAVTASKLVITDFTNLVTNGIFAGGSSDGWNFASGVSVMASPSNVPSEFALRIDTMDGGLNSWTKRIPVSPGDEVFGSLRARASGGSDRLMTVRMRLVFEDANGNQLAANHLFTQTTQSTTPVVYTGSVAAPPGAAAFYVTVQRISNDAQRHYGYLDNVIVRWKTQGELIVDGAITAAKIMANAVTAAAIAAGTITATEIASGAITTAKLDALSVTSAKITASAITGDKIAANAITAREIQSASITTALLAAGSVVADKIATNAVTAVALAANSVTANALAANSVTAGAIAANAIKAGHIRAGAIGADAIAAKAINATKLAVANLENLFDGADAYATSPFVPRTGANGGRGAWSDAAGQTGYRGQSALMISGVWSGAAYEMPSFPVTPGAEYFIRFYAASDSSWNGEAANSKLRIGDQNGAFLGSISYAETDVTHFTASTWTERSMVFRVPDGVNALTISLGNSGTAGTVYLAGFEMRLRNGGELIVDGAITTAKIMANAVTAAAIAAGTITAAEIASGAITTAKLDALSVTTAKITASAITGDKIAANAITAREIQSAAISTALLAAGSVVADKIATNAVTAVALAANSVTANALAANSVTAGAISATAITAAKIAAGAVGAEQIAAKAISASKLAISNLENLFDGADALATSPFLPRSGANGGRGDWSNAAGQTGYRGQSAIVIAGEWSGAAYEMPSFPVTPGAEYFIRFYGVRDSSWDGRSANSKLRIGDQNGGHLQSISYAAGDLPHFTASNWAERSAVLRVPDGVNALTISLGNDATAGRAYLAGFEMRLRNAGELIVDGAITARTLNVASVTADAIAAAAILASKLAANSVTANALAANSVTANALSANSVTARAIAAKSVTADAMAARSITAGNGAIDNLAVQTINIAGNAVTVPVGVSGPVVEQTGSGTYAQLARVVIPLSQSAPLLVWWSIQHGYYEGGFGRYGIQLEINGQIVAEKTDNNLPLDWPSGQAMVQGVVGNNVVRLLWRGWDARRITAQGQLAAIGAMK